ncbi:MAG: PrsW family intramembrane metalloprotease [Bacteroidota bacterium]
MPITASFFAAIIPMLTYLIFIWRMDKYEREPLTFVFVHFIWGAIGAIALGIVGSFMLTDISGVSEEYSGMLIQTVIFAPVAEEIAKGIFLLFTINSRRFDNLTDGLVYGGAIGLGFGMTENFTYFISYGDTMIGWLFLVIIRSGFSAVMHCISTATFGAFLGVAKFTDSKYKAILPFIGLVLAIFYHFMWNLSVSFDETYLYGLLFMIVLITMFVLVFKYSVEHEKRIITKELYEESSFNIIPKEFIPIISSHLRLRKGWIDEAIRKQYFRTAIKLAFAKMKSKKARGYDQQYYLNEVDVNREILRSLTTMVNQ